MNRAREKPLISIKNLSKGFAISRNFWGKPNKILRAVTNINLDIYEGECLCIVGESGCGKSTLARLVLKLVQADSGSVEFSGNDILNLQGKDLIKKRQDMQMVFQNPFSSLDPRYKVYDAIAEPLLIHKRELGKEAIKKRVYELLELVELEPAIAEKYPHQCSGGQNQRISIARALALNPKFIIADEAVSALDVSIQWKILKLFKRIQKEMGISFLFIAHNLGVVKHIADRVAVMYLGEIVEITSKDNLFTNPLHPYTQALITSAPVADPHQRDRKKIFLEGEIPKPTDIPSGCPFHSRCPIAQTQCSEVKPWLENKAGHGEHLVSCLLV